jgi:hypothetical protein
MLDYLDEIYMHLLANTSAEVAVDPRLGDGVADATAAIQRALDEAGDNAEVFIGPGRYKVTSKLTASGQRLHIRGAGVYVTTIVFAPTANGTCLEFSDSGNLLVQGSLRDISFQSDDSTYTKVAIDLIDSSGYLIENVTINGSVTVGSTLYWSGADSIGLRTKGREFGQIRNLYSACDKPVVIAGNPNSTIDIDHFHFQDLYLIANDNPCVTIDDGVNLSNVEFDGANPWVVGTYGLYWNDTTTSLAANNLRIRGMRTEQGTDDTAHSIYIAHNTGMQGLVVESCFLDPTRKGVYLRKVPYANFDTVLYGSATLEAFNATALSGNHLSFKNCFWQQGSTATLTDYILYDSIQDDLANKPIPNTADYVYGGSALNSSGRRRRIPIIATASLPAAAASEDGSIIIEDNGAGDRNIIIYAGGERFRIDGGAAF